MLTLQRIVTPQNLRTAFDKVKENNGTHGVDKISIKTFSVNLTDKLEKLRDEALSGKYRCQPCRVVDIPKNTGAFRRLAIPTVRDRVIQTAISQALVPFFEPHFEKCSYGYRPNRSYLQAIKKSRSFGTTAFR